MLLDNAARDVRYAWRSFRATPLAAITIVTTVGLGLGLVAVVFTILNSVVFRADHVQRPHELFAVERPRSADTEPRRFTRAQYEALIRETGVFSGAFAATPDHDTWIDGRRMEGPFVTGNFFQLLGVKAERGRILNMSDDRPGAAPVVVLGHRAWRTHFAGDPGVIDRTVLVNGARFHVVGVMPESFRGLAILAPDFWAPLSVLAQTGGATNEKGDDIAVEIVGRLKPGVSREQALAQLLVWDARSAPDRSRDLSVTGLSLEPRQGTIRLDGDALMLFVPLFFAFGLILMIGWANVANLLLARAVARQREIGIRLAIGASRRRIIWQLLTESLLLALVSAAIGFGISRVVLEGAIYALSSTWESGFGNIRLAVPPADWRVALFLLAGAAVSTVSFALAPSFRATRLELVRAMRGELVRDVRPGRARTTLIALQVTASVVLLICTAVFLRTSWAAATVDPGIRMTDIVTVNVVNEERRATILDLLRTEPSVTSVAACWPGILGGRPGSAEIGDAPAAATALGTQRAAGAGGRTSITYQFVSPEYFGVFGIDLVRGRGFMQAERSASSAVTVVSESVARQLWPNGDPLGQVVRLEPDGSTPTAVEKGNQPAPDDPQLTSRVFTVVGIARDVPGIRLGDFAMSGAGVYVPIGAEVARASLAMRARGDSERASRALVDRLAAIDPNMAQVSTLRTSARGILYVLGIPFWVTLVLGVLALLLTLSGLYSVLSYLVEQRTREIGVRMALGATSRTIAALVLSQSARPVGAGILLGMTLTAALGAALLAMPAAAEIASVVNLFDPVAYAASLLCIVTACGCASLIPALRAGAVDPVAALRRD